MTQNDLQLGQNNSDEVPIIVEKTARFVSKNGSEIEKMIIASYPEDARFGFLRSSEDPFHEIYQQKLAEYLAQHGSQDIQETDDHTTRSSIQIIEPPLGLFRSILEDTALLVSKKGLKAEMSIKRRITYTDVKKNPSYNFNFLKRSDPFHPFYQQKLNEYLAQGQQDEDSDDEIEGDPLPQSHIRHLPDLLEWRLPKGMTTLEEFYTIKLTAQFVAWYGDSFWVDVAKRALPQLEFMKPDGRWFTNFHRFVVEYSKILMPPKYLEQKLSENNAYRAAITDRFFPCLQWDASQKFDWKTKGAEKAMTDWHASVEKDFANKEADQDLPPPGTEDEPEPKRQNFAEPALVPEDQFLAQHSGPSTIRVIVANVIEITVESLSENVASLKEKIAGEIQIPADRLKLSGNAGFLEDDNRSLAHYNVGEGENITLTL